MTDICLRNFLLNYLLKFSAQICQISGSQQLQIKIKEGAKIRSASSKIESINCTQLNWLSTETNKQAVLFGKNVAESTA